MESADYGAKTGLMLHRGKGCPIQSAAVAGGRPAA
jgi:hypothetical protein